MDRLLEFFLRVEPMWKHPPEILINSISVEVEVKVSGSFPVAELLLIKRIKNAAACEMI